MTIGPHLALSNFVPLCYVIEARSSFSSLLHLLTRIAQPTQKLENLQSTLPSLHPVVSSSFLTSSYSSSLFHAGGGYSCVSRRQYSPSHMGSDKSSNHRLMDGLPVSIGSHRLRTVENLAPGTVRAFTTSSFNDYYKVLQVNKDATQDEIKRSYRRLALKWHPDKHQSAGKAQKEEADKKFRELAEAHETLGDPRRRKEYDLFRENDGRIFHDGDGFKGFTQPSGGGSSRFTEHHMSDSEAREMFTRMFQDVFKGSRQGSPFNVYNIEDLLKNIGGPMASTEGSSNSTQQKFITVIARNGRLIQRTVTTTTTARGSKEEVDEVDLGPVTSASGGKLNSKEFPAFYSSGRTPASDIFSVLEMLLNQSERQQQYDLKIRPKARDSRGPNLHPAEQQPAFSKQLTESNNPLTRLTRIVRRTWHSQPAQEARLMIRIKLYDALFRVLTRMIERGFRFLIRRLGGR